MLQTSLTDTVSSNVLNEKQEIEISSTVRPESYVTFLLKTFPNKKKLKKTNQFYFSYFTKKDDFLHINCA